MRPAQNNYFFGRTKLEGIRVMQERKEIPDLYFPSQTQFDLKSVNGI